TLFNYDPKFRANQFIGVGITPIIKINSFIQVRPSFYAFSPYRKIEEADDGTAFYSKKRFNDFQYIAELNAVGTISTITISGFLNYYSSHSNSFGIGLRIGWFVFNERFFE
ncbi:MAG: patatin, partial [Bacteroidaceae bacterium]|nr:patatin [Bacteroidaceae bacterium]